MWVLLGVNGGGGDSLQLFISFIHFLLSGGIRERATIAHKVDPIPRRDNCWSQMSFLKIFGVCPIAKVVNTTTLSVAPTTRPSSLSQIATWPHSFCGIHFGDRSDLIRPAIFCLIGCATFNSPPILSVDVGNSEMYILKVLALSHWCVHAWRWAVDWKWWSTSCSMCITAKVRGEVRWVVSWSASFTWWMTGYAMPSPPIASVSHF